MIIYEEDDGTYRSVSMATPSAPFLAPERYQTSSVRDRWWMFEDIRFCSSSGDSSYRARKALITKVSSQ
jgi:hypothetical protein